MDSKVQKVLPQRDPKTGRFISKAKAKDIELGIREVSPAEWESQTEMHKPFQRPGHDTVFQTTRKDLKLAEETLKVERMKFILRVIAVMALIVFIWALWLGIMSTPAKAESSRQLSCEAMIVRHEVIRQISRSQDLSEAEMVQILMVMTKTNHPSEVHQVKDRLLTKTCQMILGR